MTLPLASLELKSSSWSQHCLWPVPCRPGTYALSTWPCRSRYSDAQACQYTNCNRKDISSSNQWVIIMWSFWIWPYTGSLLSFPSITKTISFFQSFLHCCVQFFNALSSVVWVFPFYEKRGGCWVCYLLVCALDDIIPDCPNPSFIWFSIQQHQNFNCHPIPPRFDHTPNLENTSKTEKNYWWNAKSTELDRGGR